MVVFPPTFCTNATDMGRKTRMGFLEFFRQNSLIWPDNSAQNRRSVLPGSFTRFSFNVGRRHTRIIDKGALVKAAPPLCLLVNAFNFERIYCPSFVVFYSIWFVGQVDVPLNWPIFIFCSQLICVKKSTCGTEGKIKIY